MPSKCKEPFNMGPMKAGVYHGPVEGGGQPVEAHSKCPIKATEAFIIPANN